MDRLGDIGLAEIRQDILFLQDERRGGGWNYHPADADSHRSGLCLAGAAGGCQRCARGQGAEAKLTTIHTRFHDDSSTFRPLSLFIAAKACYRPPPTQKRATESTRDIGVRSLAGRHPMRRPGLRAMRSWQWQ